MDYLATPEFAQTWPEWARWLIGDPLAVVLYLVGAIVVLAITHMVINRIVKRVSTTPPKQLVPGTTDDPDYAAARKQARTKTLGSVAHSTVKVVVWVLTACLVLERFGVRWHIIVTTLGVLGVGIGLGAQSLVKDMFAGISMIAEDQFGIGDQIDADAASGTVVSMSLRVTTIQDKDGVLWYIPNGTVTRIGNKSQHQQTKQT
ncbi:MAG: mechanosensitive ion channel family protein [Micrococcales bacterium]|nr:mechanosensitive ion channel family protein [Micrococcales bacterium]